MKRWWAIPAMFVAVLYFGAIPGFAQRGGGHAGRPSVGGHGRSGLHKTGMPDRGIKTSGREAASIHTQGAQTRTVGDHLAHNTKLASKLEGLLGFSGPDAASQLQQQAEGFRNLGLFVAAVHVSHNLGIPFADLKGKMIGPSDQTLGQAIHELRPEASAEAEAKKAVRQADEDIKKNVPRS